MKNESKTVDEYIKNAQEDLRSCYNCQPHDDETGKIVWQVGAGSYMIELLEKLEVPEEQWDEVAESLYCPFCHTQLDRTADIGVITSTEMKAHHLWREWQKEYEKKFDEFHKHLQKYPYLGHAHPLGAEILNSISSFPRRTIFDESMYRARKVTESRLFSTKDVLPPDPVDVVIPEGRFNHFGQSVFYMAEFEVGAAVETLSGSDGLVWMQKLRVRNVSDVLDVTTDFLEELPVDKGVLAFGLVYSNWLAIPAERAAGWKPEYFVPRYVADCAKLKGMRGIYFNSADSASRKNLVLFDWTEDEVLCEKEPYLYTHRNELTDLFGTNAANRIDPDSIDDDDIPF